MTSNLGTADLRKANVGFTTADSAMSYERMKEKVYDALKQHFRPEFLNRIDETIVFHELSKLEVVQMVDMMLKRLTGQLEGQGLGIEVTQAAKEELASIGYDPQLGARPLRRAIQRQIEGTRCPRRSSTRSSRRRDHRRRRRAQPRARGQAALYVPRRRGLRAPVLGRASPRR